MKARAVCLPMGKPLVGISLLPVAILIFSLVALLLTSCSNTANNESKPLSCLAETATPINDFAYQYFNTNTTQTKGIRRFGDDDENATASISSLDELRSITNNPSQTYTINNKKDTIISGRKGVKVRIPQDCFELKDPNAKVKIILKEYTTAADLYFANLTTCSNGQMLESGGTVYINAMSDGQVVNMKKGKHISLAFPTGKAKPGMQTFYGERKADGTMNWQLNNSAQPQTNAAFDIPNNDTKSRVAWVREDVLKSKYYQRVSILVANRFHVQAFGSNDHCTKLTDSSEYKNVLEYINANFTISPQDFNVLKGSYLAYSYSIDKNGNICKKPYLRSEFHTDAIAKNSTYKRQAVLRLKKQIAALLKKLPKAEPTAFNRQEILRFYIIDYAEYRDCPTVKINDNKIKRDYVDVVWHPDTMTIKEYDDYIALQKKKDAQRRDSLMNNDGEYYFLNAGKLGWINCDRFSPTVNKQNVYVKAGDNKNLSVKIIFKKILGVLPLSVYADNTYMANSIPMGEDVRYIVVDKRPDGLYYAVKDAITGPVPVEGFTFKPMTVKAMRDELASLN